MKMRMGALAATLLAIPLLTVPMASSTAAESPPDQYVAFGDSFVSGPGILPQSPDGCGRSEKNFPSLVAERLGADLTDASCSGATLDNLWDPQGGNPRQLDALSEDTTLVTFGTLGGNDMGLVGLAYDCFLKDCGGEEGDAPLQDFESLREEIRDGLADTKTRAPNADIVVVGYSHYVPPTSCAAIGGISPSEAVYFQGLIDRLSAVLEEEADAAGVGFADMNAIPGVEEHTVCAEPEQQYIRAINTYNDGAPLHPSTCGMAAYAQQVTRAVQELRGEPVDEFVDPCPPTTNEPVDPDPDDDAETLEALAAAASTLKLRRTCRNDGHRVVMRVAGGRKLARKVVFKVGGHRVKVDGARPFVARRPAAKLSRHRGRVKARVVLRKDGVRQVHRLVKPRPRCMRR